MAHHAAHSCLISLTLALSSSAFAVGSPIGQGAKFVLDHQNDRTTALISGGTIATQVQSRVEDAVDGHVYKVKADLTLDLPVIGSQSSSQVASVPEHYLDHTLVETLRSAGHYEDTHLKADHLGYEDVATSDGHSYSHCDKVRLYDLKIAADANAFAPVTALLSQVAAADQQAFAGPGLPDAKDISLTALLCDEVPVFGVAKVDILVNVLGNEIKIGADYAAE